MAEAYRRVLRYGTSLRSAPTQDERLVGKVQKKENGAPGAIRTPGPQIRSLMLYPAELRVHGDALLGAPLRIRNPYFATSVA
jgi:hypothetical protein